MKKQRQRARRKVTPLVRCCILDKNGDQCRNKATITTKVFFDRECHPKADLNGWAKIPCCDKHNEVL